MAKTKTEIHVTTVFDGELDAADVFVSLIAQKYGQNTGKENLAKTQDLGYNKDEVQKNRVPSGLCGLVLCQEKVQIKYALLMLSYPAKASALSSNAA